MAFPQAATSSSAGAPPVIDLDHALALAMSDGNDNKALLSALAAAQAADRAAQAKNAFTMGVSGNAGWTYGFDEPGNYGLSKALESSYSGTGASPGVAGSLTAGFGQTKIGVSAAQSIMPGFGLSGPTTIGFTLTQTLWDGYPGGQLKATIDKSGLTVQGKALSTDLSQKALAASVKKAYYGVLGYQRALDLQRSIQGKQEALLKQIQATYDLKTASLLDLKGAQYGAHAAEVAAKLADHNLRLAKIRFANMLNLPGDSSFDLAELPEPGMPAFSADEAVARGLANRADLAQYDLSIKSSMVDLALAKSANDITVALIGGANLAADFSSPSFHSAQSLFAGLKISLPLIDSGAAMEQVRNVEQQLATLRFQQQSARLGAAADIRDAYESLSLQLEQLAVAKETADWYDMKLAVVRSQVEHGTANNQDLLTAATDAATYQTAYLTARNNSLAAAAQLQSVMGE